MRAAEILCSRAVSPLTGGMYAGRSSSSWSEVDMAGVGRYCTVWHADWQLQRESFVQFQDRSLCPTPPRTHRSASRTTADAEEEDSDERGHLEPRESRSRELPSLRNKLDTFGRWGSGRAPVELP